MITINGNNIYTSYGLIFQELTGMLDMPKRKGLISRDWGTSIEPFLDAADIEFEGRNLELKLVGKLNAIKENLIILDPALFQVGSIDNFTGANKTDATSIRSIDFLSLPENRTMTLDSKTNTPFSVQFYNAAGAFMGGVQQSESYPAVFITGRLNSLGQLKSTEILKSI